MNVDRARQQDRTGNFNDAALLLLGALRYLDAFAEAAEARSISTSRDDDFLIAALGLISVRRSLRRWALHAATEENAAPATAAAAPARRGALR